MLEGADKRGLPSGAFHRGHAQRLPFPDQSFDIVLSTCIFHHTLSVEHPSMVQEMLRVLKPLGWLITFEHNPLNPLTRWIVSHCPIDKGVSLIFPQALSRIYRAKGFVKLETRYIIFFPSQLKFLAVSESWLHWFPFGGQYFVAGQKKSTVNELRGLRKKS